MRVGVVLPAAETDGQGGMPDWPAIRDFALAAEAGGLDSVWMFDHFFYRPDPGTTEGMHEAWTIVSAISAVTQRVEIGTLVLCSSFRAPGLVAKMAVTADDVSGGRLILGLGAGWHDPEYDAFGFPRDHRVDRFEEALEIIVPLLRGETVTVDGRFHRAEHAVLAPPPRRKIPILIAAKGPRMLRLTARYADAWNTAWFGEPDDRSHARLEALGEALETEGRDPASMLMTVGLLVRDPDGRGADDGNAFAGSVDELARMLDRYAGLGFDHAVVELLPMTVASVERLGAAVRLRSGGR